MARRPGTSALCATIFLALACGAPEKQVRLNRWGKPLPETGRPVPAWVKNIPGAGRSHVYAVGRSGPTYWPQDGINNASEDARGKLALSLTSHIENLGQNVEQNGGKDRVLDVNKEATDLVMQNSRIEATWVDEAGDMDEPGSVWALASIELAGKNGEARPASTIVAAGVAQKSTVPAWLDRLPKSNGNKLYAAGYSGPTFRAESAVEYAGDAAVDNLASALRSHVQAYNLLVETSTGLSVDDFAHTEDPDQTFKDLVKKNAKVESTWVDKDGDRPGDPPGAVWALASIDVTSTKGNYNAVQNDDLGPALDKKGGAAEPAASQPPATASSAPAANAAAPPSTAKAVPATTGSAQPSAVPASAAAPAK